MLAFGRRARCGRLESSSYRASTNTPRCSRVKLASRCLRLAEGRVAGSVNRGVRGPLRTRPGALDRNKLVSGCVCLKEGWVAEGLDGEVRVSLRCRPLSSDIGG